ncbi:hypothetical protein BBK36DRAFT_1178762 [Trichoderma citrinoviride]|uniref:Uncharacterized protein n=1 Tax=Trichoderma citrinoviride TaxID=58853 RepID=A0A2T4B4Q7_9HYPO|nr:hypothetical protein BBK36DRAFT_1178762 [Trichoderma citrinoviride]PTB64248.1 hypothetical protein BBK36DRAFT_1178762 [Trichoderma citrinoviride]
MLCANTTQSTLSSLFGLSSRCCECGPTKTSCSWSYSNRASSFFAIAPWIGHLLRSLRIAHLVSRQLPVLVTSCCQQSRLSRLLSRPLCVSLGYSSLPT